MLRSILYSIGLTWLMNRVLGGNRRPRIGPTRRW